MTDRLPPSRIIVGPTPYEVRIAELDGKIGETQRCDTTINLHPSQSHESMQETLLHETLHAIMWTAGLGLTETVEERVVSTLSPYLLGVLRNNPALVKYLGIAPPS